MTAAITAREEMILPSESNRSNCALDGVRVQFGAAVVQEAGQTVKSLSSATPFRVQYRPLGA